MVVVFNQGLTVVETQVKVDNFAQNSGKNWYTFSMGVCRVFQNALPSFDQSHSLFIFVPLGELMNMCDFCIIPKNFRPPLPRYIRRSHF